VAERDRAEGDEAAKETLELVGMGWAAAAEPSALSSGQRKLVGVARALVAKPKVLCLDEPRPAWTPASRRSWASPCAASPMRASPCCSSSTT